MREESKSFDDFDTRDNDIKVKNMTIIFIHIKNRDKRRGKNA